MPSKIDIRKFVKQKVKLLTPEERKTQSDEVLKRLAVHPLFVKSKVVMLYYSLPDEVDTHQFVKQWAAEKVVLLPVVQGEDLELRQYKSDSEICVTDYRIEAPVAEAYAFLDRIDLIVVPGVAFDKEGRRMGRGRGFYDRFLAKGELCNAYKLGLCFPSQIVESVPVEPHDICMDDVLF